MLVDEGLQRRRIEMTTIPEPDLDGIVAAPDHHRVIFENDRVRVLETIIRSGDVTPLHLATARWLSDVRVRSVG
jgi:hypothetical protein